MSGLALILCWPGLPVTQFTTQLENVYGTVGLLGVITMAILGMLYKIVPFLVWYHCYSHHVGRAAVPSLGQMYSERVQAGSFLFCLAGLFALALATALGHATGVRWATGLFGVGLALFALNLGLILSHFWRSNTILCKPKPTPRSAIPSTPLSVTSSIPNLG
jgi:hypothetical protein